MKRLLIAVTIATATVATPILAADIGVSVSVGQPGFYGRLDIGDYPQPMVIYQQPRHVERGVSIYRQPIYMHVPPGHAKNWRKHCGKYNACGERVYFVQDDWYNHEYVPRYQKRQDERRNSGRSDYRGDGRDGNNDRRDKDHDRGRGR